MKTLNIKMLVAGCVDAAAVPSLFDSEGVEYTQIDVLNWPSQFPYAPAVSFALACTRDSFLIHYKVCETGTRALAVEDHGRVWEDACVEFFLIPGGDGCYYNIECNCIGTLHIASGTERHGRVPAPSSVMEGVHRWTSLPHKPFADVMDTMEWEVALVIPLSTFFQHKLLEVPLEFKANFYKCGGTGPREHYLSWSPVSTPAPDFHRPEFFGILRVVKHQLLN